ncbi:hypothetical protein DY000_02036845 [Brassica cretica]|uniref:PPPDE domain-containing protein n=1 Tax=Brassica cretica TaxID=69181 RepID=A0ABQ7BCY7_BRACR|nr:hypothetical protein DY000_02036845 [Brassica cretica]
MMFCRNVSVRRKKKKNPGSVPVYLNVYDLTPMNVYGYWLGIGIYHSGLEDSVVPTVYWKDQTRIREYSVVGCMTASEET